MSPEQHPFDDNQTPTLEMAYVLFMDIVGYSRMPTDIQQETLRRLQQIVRSGNEFRNAQQQKRLISLPTGDGMALAFFTDPEGCVRCAVEITRALQGQDPIPMRMGMHAGPVYRVEDINTNQNVAGEGINIAQRVMDCGDAGHILVSKSLADVLRQLTGWMGSVQDLGEVSVKHGVRVHVFNLLVDGAGNANRPKKFDTKDDGKEEPQKERWKKATIAAAGIIVAAGIVLGIYRKTRIHAVAERPKIALLGFQDQMHSNGTAWVNASLTENLTGELEAGEKVVTSPSETVSLMKIEFALPEETSYSAATMGRIHDYLQCDYVVYGSYFDPGKDAGGRVKLNVRMQDAKTGEILATVVEEGTEQTLGDLAARVGSGLRAKLNLSGISMTESAEIQASTPSTPEASRFYFDGVRKMRMFDLLGAQVSLQSAIKEDANFSLAHADLAEVWKGQGYDENAKEEAKKAFELSTHLGREDRTRVQALDRELSSDWDKAADLYRSLWNLFPEKPEYAYRAADVQIRGGKAKEALETVAELRKQPGAMAKNPMIDLREAEAQEALGDLRSEANAAQSAAERAHTNGARLLEAQALWRLCEAKYNLGEFDKALEACNRGQANALATNYELLVARTHAVIGTIYQSEGKLAEGIAAEQNALDIAKSIGSQRDVIGALQNTGYMYSFQGKHEEAVKSYRNAQEVAEEIKDKSAILAMLNNTATEYQANGEFGKALAAYNRSLALAIATENKQGRVDASSNIGNVESLQGRLAAGLQSAEAAVRLARDSGFKDKVPMLLCVAGDIQVDQGDLAAAENSYNEALTTSTQLGDKTTKATAQLSQSKMELERGNYKAAEQAAREAAAEFKSEGMRESGSDAQIALAESLMEQGRLDDAGSALAEAKAGQPGDKAILLALDWASVRLLVRRGNAAQARATQQQALAMAKKMGVVGWQLRLELTGGELGLVMGRTQEARTMLQRVEKEARSKGYALIEGKAHSLLARGLSDEIRKVKPA